MRVIAGTARGVPIKAPAGRDVRPTLDRVREAVFNILAPRVPGARFLDLYAGSGAIGIEALSRGAAHATFVEADPANVRIISENLAKTRLTDRASCITAPLPGALRRLRGPVDLVYVDAPFDRFDPVALLQALTRETILAPDAWTLLEHPARNQPPQTIGRLARFDQRQYGQVAVSFYA